MKPRRHTPAIRSLRRARLAIALLALSLGGAAMAGGHGRVGSEHSGALYRFHPAGGWHPDAGGLLHWWNPHCFPRCNGPDDYCRKPMPQVCWPPYTSDYRWGPVSPLGAPARP